MGFSEENLRLKGLLTKAESLEMLNPETYKLTLLQVVNGYEALAKKKRKEAVLLREQIAFCEAQASSCEMMVQILADIVENLIRKEEQRREEAQRQEEERRTAQKGPSGPSKQKGRSRKSK